MASNLPPGAGLMGFDMVKHRCPECGAEWEAPMYFELGGWFYEKDEEGFCPNGCDVEPELD